MSTVKPYAELTMSAEAQNAVLARTLPENLNVIKAMMSKANSMVCDGMAGGAAAYLKPLGSLSHLTMALKDMSDSQLLEIKFLSHTILEFIRSKQ